MPRTLLLLNLLPAMPVALWLLLSRRYWRAAILLAGTLALTYVWPLPPVPMLAALTIALSLRRLLQLLAWSHRIALAQTIEPGRFALSS